MEVDDRELARFMEATHASFDQAQFFLEACGGNYERALAMFYEQTGAGGQAYPPDVPPRPLAPSNGTAPRRGRAVAAYGHGGAGALPPPLHLLNALLGAPFAIVGGSVRLVVRTLGFSARLAGAIARRVLPAGLSRALARAGAALAAAGAEVPPAQAAAEFVRGFADRYGAVRPRWQECGWGEAASRAHQEGKFLFVYLHSAQHQDADVYCRDTLCDPNFVSFVNQHFLCWGGDVRRSDAFRLASSLGAARYPYAAMLAFSGPRTRLITCVEGTIPPPQLQAVLQAGLDDHGALLWQEQAERRQRDSDRRLREEQDAEYQRSLEADRAREAAKEEAAARAAAAARAEREAEERARAEAAAEERRRADTAAALERRKAEKRAALPEEPDAGTPGTTLLRIRLPHGSSHQRRFLADQALQVVYDFVDSLEEVSAVRYSLATTFPRRVYSQDSLGKSLQELELAPQAVLLLQPEDDD